MSLDSSSLVSSGAMMSSVDDAESLEILRLLGECDAIYTQKEIIWSKKLIHLMIKKNITMIKSNLWKYILKINILLSKYI